ncbi:MAG: iron-containing alcohol dehydrogenase [Bacteriovorax sp.]|nr:iron-containing alcohol dehydrogenase [Bacteriovorax sp.]
MNHEWNAKYNYNFPTLVRFGKDVILELGPHLKDQGLKHVLVVSDPGLVKLPVFTQVTDMLKSAGLQVAVFSGIDKNPVKSNVLKGAEVFAKNNCDSIIGFGGGASMDVARAIALKINHHRDLFDYDDALGGDQYVTGEIPYFVTVPTTSGTGSEVGRSTVISDDITHAKKILFSPKLMARKVFADPMLSMELPSFVTAATGMDALTHNIEAYLAKGFSPMCDGIALEGIKLIAQSIEKATHNPDFESRAKMMMGSLMGATAFQKGLGIVHSLAHPLSTLVDMHHGLANAIMLPYGMEFNKSVSGPRMTTIAIAIGLKDTSPEGLIAWINDLNKKLNIPSKLSTQNVNSSHLEALAELAIKDPCWPSNEKPVTKKDFLEIYSKSL